MSTENNMRNKKPVRYWTFESSSGSKTYQAIFYDDSSTSCDCMGWTRRVAPDGSRSCKHTRSIEMGRADYDSVAFSEAKETPKEIETTPKLQFKAEPLRKISW